MPSASRTLDSSNSSSPIKTSCFKRGNKRKTGSRTSCRSQEAAQHLDASARTARRAVDITYEQYRQGAVDYIAVYVFELQLTLIQDQLAAARGTSPSTWSRSIAP